MEGNAPVFSVFSDDSDTACPLRNYFYRLKLSLTTSFDIAISDNNGICELLDDIFLL